MLKLPVIARMLLGLIFFVFGLNGFLQFIPMPELSEEGASFMGSLAGSGYFFPVLKLTETVCGVFLLTGRFVPLALTIIAPVVVQILLFHVALEPTGMPMAVLLVALTGYLGLFGYRSSFCSLLSATPED